MEKSPPPFKGEDEKRKKVVLRKSSDKSGRGVLERPQVPCVAIGTVVDANFLGVFFASPIMPPMPNSSFQLRDTLIHKKIQTVGRVVFVDAKRQKYRVVVDEDMPLEEWAFHEVELYKKDSLA